MAHYEASQVFAALKSAHLGSQAKNDRSNVQKTDIDDTCPKRTLPTKSNEIQVSATADMSLSPDKSRITIFVSSKKDNVQEAKNSVSRRLDYILQVLNNHHIKVHLHFNRTSIFHHEYVRLRTVCIRSAYEVEL